ncbi:NAD(P)/FAD-dependent oxidoreductase [Flexivirga meconopsidis]|uniref:NAD(P)/FAD-dependent oxidoreductase n=1 Tax=Flexivirga meconopsidis TaxID=2977121 RepID=UPI00223EDBD1|nr:FAD-dependent oxidoreductase [Flexivirga meconopsidis]
MASLDGTKYDYVIVGGGVAGAAAAKAIRERDAEGSVLVLGLEPDPPVYRPDLSKGLWLSEETKLDDIWLMDGKGAELHTSLPVTSIDTEAHEVEIDGGAKVGYGSLLIATGAQPRHLDLPESDRIVYYRTVADYRRLRELAAAGSAVTVVGGGYIGAELTSALAQNDVKVTMILEGELVQEHMFPASIAELVTKDFRGHGVELLTGTRVVSGEVTGDTVAVRTQDGKLVEGVAAVVGIGVEPRTKLAQDSGLTVEGGIVVDDRLRTSATDVYAAGDDTSFPDPLLGRRRVEHVDNAETMGKVAGENMAGADQPYDHTPFFWSDLFANGYEAIGELSSAMDTVEDWNGEHTAAVVYYLADGTVRGVLLWNTWDSVEKAREVIEKSGKGELGKDQLSGLIPPG